MNFNIIILISFVFVVIPALIKRFELENKIDAVMAENDLLKAQIAEINAQLKVLNMLAMN